MTAPYIARSSCPVLVARGCDQYGGPVVVGVDGSAASMRAVEFAAEEAAVRKTDLVAVHAWTPPAVVGPPAMRPLAYDAPPVRQVHERLLADTVARIAARHPDITVRTELVAGSAGKVSAEQARHAQLVVAGKRGRSGPGRAGPRVGEPASAPQRSVSRAGGQRPEGRVGQ